MKRLFLSFLAVFFWCGASAQNPLYTKIKEMLQEQHPELSLTDKLIAYNTWSLEDVESRERNKSFDKVYDIYQVARLKGGRRGLVVVSIHLDGSTSTAATTMYHDGVRKLVLLDGKSLKEELRGAPANMVFDSSGSEVYRSLRSDDLGASINQLITR